MINQLIDMKSIYKLVHELREKKPYLLYSFVLNSFFLFVFTLLFEVTAKSDDYDMTMLLYGSVNGENSAILMYSNIIWGRFLCLLLNEIPNISWYYVIQWVLMFIALNLITYVLLKKTNTVLVTSVLLAFVYYEFFIRITFSKTSGLLCVVGIILLFYEVFETNKRVCFLIVAIIIVLSGYLIREQILILCMGLSLSLIPVYFTRRHSSMMVLLKNMIILGVLFAIIWLTSKCLGKYSIEICKNDPLWSNYYTKDNSARASIQDYGMPNYDLFEEEYSELNISRNDLVFWFNTGNYADVDRLDSTVLSNIRAISTVYNGIPKIKILLLSLKNMAGYLCSNTIFYLFLFTMSCYIICGGRIIEIIAIAVFPIMAYIYLFLRGRTQHHIDVIVFLFGSIVYLYFTNYNVSRNTKRHIKFVLVILSFVFISRFYGQIYSSSYYGTDFGLINSQKELYGKTYNQLELLKEDTEHLYLLNAYDTNRILCCFTPNEVIEKRFYHNLYRMNLRFVPVFRNVLKDFGVSNPINEIINSNTMYYYISKTNDAQKNVFLEYIREHYNEEAMLFPVKSTDQGTVYRFYDEELWVDDTDLMESDDLIKDYTIDYQKSTTTISGYIYEENTDSFAQNVYLKTVDKVTGEEEYFLTNQGKNYDIRTRDKMNGFYSFFNRTIDYSKKKLDKVDVYIILENNNGVYEIPVTQ